MLETPACYSSHQPRQGGGPLAPRWPDVEPGDGPGSRTEQEGKGWGAGRRGEGAETGAEA